MILIILKCYKIYVHYKCQPQIFNSRSNVADKASQGLKEKVAKIQIWLCNVDPFSSTVA